MMFLCRHKISLQSLFILLTIGGLMSCGYAGLGRAQNDSDQGLVAYDEYALLGALRPIWKTGQKGSKPGKWKRFQVNARVNERGVVHFQERIAAGRAQYMAIDYTYRLQGNAAHALQGKITFFNEKDREVSLEVMLRVQFKEKSVHGYVNSVAKLAVEGWDGVAMINSLGETPLMQIDFGENVNVDFFNAPFSYLRYGADDAGTRDFAVGRGLAQHARQINGLRLHYRFAQSAQSKLKIQSWHWLEPSA
jgi:hypothetical protein